MSEVPKPTIAIGVLIFAVATSGALLIGCSSKPPQNVLTRSDDQVIVAALPPSQAGENDRPTFGFNEVDAEDAVTKNLPVWGKKIAEMEHSDSLTGGRSKMLMFHDNSATLYIMPDGRVWRYVLIAGMGERCGSSTDRKATAAAAIKIADPTASSSASVAAAGSNTWFDGMETARAIFHQNSGCVVSFSAKAK